MELKRLHRRRPVSDDLSTENQPTSVIPISSQQINSSAKEQPLFTLKQVSVMLINYYFFFYYNYLL